MEGLTKKGSEERRGMTGQGRQRDRQRRATSRVLLLLIYAAALAEAFCRQGNVKPRAKWAAPSRPHQAAGGKRRQVKQRIAH